MFHTLCFRSSLLFCAWSHYLLICCLKLSQNFISHNHWFKLVQSVYGMCCQFYLRIRGTDKSCIPPLVILKLCFLLVFKFWRENQCIQPMLTQYCKIIQCFCFLHSLPLLISVFQFCCHLKVSDWLIEGTKECDKVVKCLHISIFSRWRVKKRFRVRSSELKGVYKLHLHFYLHFKKFCIL